MSSSRQSVKLSRAIFDAQNVPFKEHIGENWRRNYLAMTVPFAPIAKVKFQIEQLRRITLKNRGEAHITVITPVEYRNIADSLRIERINRIALDNNIQHASFKIIGIGSGSKNEQQTFFIVLQADELLKLRYKIHEEFVKNGGDAQCFNPGHYFPHITIGFTSRDLHEADGVLKDKNSLVYRVNFVRES